MAAAAGLVAEARADFVKDLVSIHTEATGGRAKLAGLKTLKATGVTRGAGGELKFVMWAARPNRICTEVTDDKRIITQGWDGEGAPWTADSATRQIALLSGERADEFKVDAEFDDPLLPAKGRQVSLDYMGEVELEGRALLKVLVTQNFTMTSFVYLDTTTYLIVRRDVIRRVKGADVTVRTDYDDFRSVGGVILPHRLVMTRDGKRVSETVIDRMEANAVMPAGVFAPPKTTKSKAVESGGA